MSITPASSIPLSVDYTSRDYYSLREQVIKRIQDRVNTPDGNEWTASDPSDFGVAIAEAFAYVGDMLSYYIDRTANEAFISTATQRDTILAIANSYGYTPSGYKQASVTLTFYNSDSASLVVPAGTTVSGDVVVGDTVHTLTFTTLADLYVAAQVGATPGSGTVLATEGVSVTLISGTANEYGELIGTSDGTPGMSFVLEESTVVDGSVEVYVQDGDVYSKWESAQHIMDYGPTDLVFTVSSDENNRVSITFGDGVSGAIPVLFSEIRARYIVGGGGLGNVPAFTLNTLEHVPGLSDSQVTALQATLTVTNESPALGGVDPESDNQIRAIAPYALRALNRAVTLDDYANLAYTVTGVGKAQAAASVWTSVNLYIAPVRNATDTDPAPGLDDLGAVTAEFTSLKAQVEEFIANKVLIGTTVSVHPPTYVDAVMVLTYTKLPQYTAAEVEQDIKNTVLTAFGYNGMNFKDTIYPQDIEFIINQVNGVKTCRVTALHEVAGSGLTTLTGGDGEIFRFIEENLTVSPTP